MWQAYHTVGTIDDALQLLATHAEKARLIAGGTDILIELDRGIRRGIDALIDISRLPGLRVVDESDGVFTLGALTTHNDVVGHAQLRTRALPLVQAAWEVGAPQIRNRATIAGNVITGSPANDTIVPLWAMNADILLQSASSARTVPIRSFYTGVRRTVMMPDEMLTGIRLRGLQDNQRGVFLKLGLRRAQAISVVNCAAVLTFDPAYEPSNPTLIIAASIALGCVAPTIISVSRAENSLIGHALTPEIIQAAAILASEEVHPISDVRSSAEYRSAMVQVLVTRALRAILTHTERDTLPDDPAMLWAGADFDLEQVAAPVTALNQQDAPIQLTVNGIPRASATGQHKTLLRFLREDLALPGTKEGCAEGECGACTVYLDGSAVMACMIPALRAGGCHVTTVEGLATPGTTPDIMPGATSETGVTNVTEPALHPVQSAFMQTGAVQCGYCTPGFLMAGAKLLDEHPQPTTAQIEQSISGNLCRCTGYYQIVEAIRLAAQANIQPELNQQNLLPNLSPSNLL